MVHIFLIGVLLGWGAAIPIGPLNLEIVRRNLRFGTPAGLAIAAGACLGDITYLTLLSLGALSILTHPFFAASLSLVGACILGWFGVSALRTTIVRESQKPLIKKPLWRHTLEGYLLVMINPYTVLFWLSISTQIAHYAMQNHWIILTMGAGVIIGVSSWASGLNILLHYTRHKLSATTILWFNRIGGVIILGFAIAGVLRVLC